MGRKVYALPALLMILALLLSACAAPAPAPTAAPTAVPPTAAPAEAPTQAPAPTQPPAPTQTSTESKPLDLPGALKGMTWDQIVAAANGQEVDWWMWGGDDEVNKWVNGWFAQQMKQRYNITVKQVPVAGPTEFINQVLGEKNAGKDTGGAVDIMWINGENFRTMKEANLLYGPFACTVPSGQYYDWSQPDIAYDFGYPVDCYEMPWGSAQVVLEYDSARVPEPPKDMAALIQWIKDHPGRFTYPAPPDFTGSAWVRHMFYYATGGYQQFLKDFDQKLFDEKAPACWKLLNDLEPYLWRKGETYPETIAKLDDLFVNGEVDFAMNYGPEHAQVQINSGNYPETVRTAVLEDGTIANTNYIAIAYNAAHLAAAVVAVNFLGSPECQANTAETLGRLVPLWLDKVPQEYKDRLANRPKGPAVLPDDVLAAHRLPELQSPWLVAIEKGWEENVLQK